MSEKDKEKDYHVPAEYLEWLYNLVGGDEVGHYRYLMKRLHSKEFYWIVPNDDNRAEDGKALRAKFTAETGKADMDILFGPCSILEMLIGLSRRIENSIMSDPDLGDRTAVWFWTMIRNLKLDKYTDESFTPDTFGEIDKILTTFVSRKYKKNGRGGLFPIRKPQADQRTVEIWYQMSEYFRQKFGVGS